MTDATKFNAPSIATPAHWQRTGLLITLVAVALTSVLGCAFPQ